MIKTLKSRLVLWHTLLFIAMSVSLFGYHYASLVEDLNDRLDHQLLGDAEEIVFFFNREGFQAAVDEMLLEVNESDRESVCYRIFSPGEEVHAATDLTFWGGLPRHPTQKPPPGDYRFDLARVPEHEFKVRSIYYGLQDGSILQLGVEPVDNGRLFSLIDRTFWVAFGILVFFGIPLSFLISRRAFRSIDRLRLSLEQVGRGDMFHPVATSREGSEIESLITSFNLMQQRIRGLLEELRNVTNNIAHDLRSPVTRIRGMAETTLTGPQDLADYQEMTGSIVEECDTLVGMINIMLEIAEADAGVTKITLSSVDMAKMALDVADLFMPLAEDKEIQLVVDVPDTPLCVQGDRSRLQRALANLLDNALKYTPERGKVVLAAATDNGRVWVSVQDTGSGISETDQPHVFERFFRADPSRSTPGNGLGLSLVETIARLHHGEVHVTSELGKGSRFQLTLPVAP